MDPPGEDTMATPFDTKSRVAAAQYVRPASDPQLSFIRTLLAERDWKSVEDAEFVARTAIVSVALRWIDSRDLDEIPESAKAILAGKGTDGEMINAILIAAQQEPLAISEASDLIGRLKTVDRDPAVSTEREDGFYMLGDTIVKLYHTVHGANKQVGAKFVGVITEKVDAADSPTGKMRPAEIEWEYGGMALARNPRLVRMTPDQAAEFGQVYGRCGRCASPLTKQESIERGLGPVCASKA
ncbi:hypothetical protein PBI_BERNARDO_46 [Mycobacterium phage Bernardo]|uniref:Uncharacterized protein n=1 Tax=Mycobacterium phage Bernardo TaxID=1429903 RepID=V5R964_9CAUD|nr:hypothetical protein X818_gp046 [Mycobacterium phage Bernardo]AHB31723.1 hypothetical protein PBI_BERNARDO_46 [Mycobacterium phage Bernardo]